VRKMMMTQRLPADRITGLEAHPSQCRQAIKAAVQRNRIRGRIGFIQAIITGAVS
jgi:hypothetical protein